jgi:hypothetical protein
VAEHIFTVGNDPQRDLIMRRDVQWNEGDRSRHSRPSA